MLRSSTGLISKLTSGILFENVPQVCITQSRHKSSKPCSSSGKSGKGGKSKSNEQCKTDKSREQSKGGKKKEQCSSEKEKEQCKTSKGNKGEQSKSEKEQCKSDKGSKKEQCSTGGGDSDVSEVPKIAINGFGRIGRMVMRVATEHSCPLEIVAINDAKMSPELMAYALKYDSTHGRFVGDVKVNGKQLNVDGKNLCVYSEADPKVVPWKDLKVDYVVEATGVFKSAKQCQAHLDGGAKKVVVTAPIEDGPMYVVGVNLEEYDPCKSVVSCGSCATNALAPLAKVIHETFGIEEGIMNTVHAVTPSQKILDATSSKKWRDGRGGLQNMIPSSTGAAKSVGKVIPELEGKITAMSTRVPIANVSMVDFTCRLKKEASLDDLKCALCEAKDGPMMGIIDVTTEQVVSSDFIGSHYSCVYDTSASMAVNNKLVKVIAWYDNEYGFTCRLIDLIKFMHAEKLAQN